jgi:mono/diheme cytochrome c family protein
VRIQIERTHIALFGLFVIGATLIATLVFFQKSADEETVIQASADEEMNSFLSVSSPVPGAYFTSKTEVSAETGRGIYLENCAVCHGLFGRGDGPRASSFGEYQYIPDLSDGYVIDGRGDEVMENIKEGLHRLEVPLIVMPQFKYILAQSDIESVHEYLKILPEIAPALME